MADANLPASLTKTRSLWGDARTRLFANRAAMVSLMWIILIVLASMIGPAITGHRYEQVYGDYVKVPGSLTAYPKEDTLGPAIQRIAARGRFSIDSYTINGTMLSAILQAPRPIDERLLALFERSDLFGKATVNAREDGGKILKVTVPLKQSYFLFGTDANGRDLLTRTVFAGRISLSIGLLASMVALVIGVIYGATSGYAGGRVDMVMMRIVDILYSLPFIFFVIMLVVFFGRNFILMFLAVGAVEWLDMARIVRGQTLSIKRQEYVQAAEALGVEPRHIVLRHIIPNALGPVIVYVTLLVPRVILLESFLSFLGLGVQEPMTSWGVLIADGARNIQGAPGMLI
ncbi:MAG: ABC transporter permease, partial [Beijerinckiaceae bacterium]